MDDRPERRGVSGGCPDAPGPEGIEVDGFEAAYTPRGGGNRDVVTIRKIESCPPRGYVDGPQTWDSGDTISPQGPVSRLVARLRLTISMLRATTPISSPFPGGCEPGASISISNGPGFAAKTIVSGTSVTAVPPGPSVTAVPPGPESGNHRHAAQRYHHFWNPGVGDGLAHRCSILSPCSRPGANRGIPEDGGRCLISSSGWKLASICRPFESWCLHSQ